MDNKKITFSGCKSSQKTKFEPHQNCTGSYEKKKRRGTGWTSRYTEYQKVER